MSAVLKVEEQQALHFLQQVSQEAPGLHMCLAAELVQDKPSQTSAHQCMHPR
jgi:hypothetical protein